MNKSASCIPTQGYLNWVPSGIESWAFEANKIYPDRKFDASYYAPVGGGTATLPDDSTFKPLPDWLGRPSTERIAGVPTVVYEAISMRAEWSLSLTVASFRELRGGGGQRWTKAACSGL